MRPIGHVTQPVVLVAILALVTAACSQARAGGAHAADVSVTATPLAEPTACHGSFSPIDLDHVTRGTGRSVNTFDGTGAGVAVGDLDDDGRDDIVLANLHGPTTLHRNLGGLRFERHQLIEGRIRQPIIVDYDGDGDLDITLTTGLGRPVLLRSVLAQQPGQPLDVDAFERAELPGVTAATFAMAWGDLGGDGDLDLVTGSYNAELTFRQRHQQLLGSHVGVVTHERSEKGLAATQLSEVAQALAVHIADVDADGRADVVVGNDLATADRVWLGGDEELTSATPFTTTSYSTMSLDAADVDNDGDLELFSTDMHPMDDSPATRQAYAPVAEEMASMPMPDDIQHPVNVLQMDDGSDFVDVADDLGIRATGWSWSGVFGDLNNDGDQDLYVVNGMVSEELFGDAVALVEPNQAFRGGADVFTPAPEWGLADTAQGRGMVMADLDDDGDLDIVVNNLNDSARIHVNGLCDQGQSLLVDLRWPDSANSRAIGATITVDRAAEAFTRTVDAARGYLSGPTPTAHIGLGRSTGTVEVEVRWPDGVTSMIGDVVPNQRLQVTRG